MSRKLGRSYKQEKPDSRWDAIVIGSGIGGLACAALLAKHGRRRVLVLERHTTAGGFTHTFHRPGFEWDVGVHYVGQCGEGEPVRALFDEVTGGRLAWARMPETYDRVLLRGEPYDLVAGGRAFVDTLAKRFPGRRDDITRYLNAVRAVASTSGPYFAARALPPSLASLAEPLAGRAFHRWSSQTVAQVVEPIVGSGPLYEVLTAQCGDYGLTPQHASFAIHAMVVGHYLRGAYYPVGGSSRIAAGAHEVIAEAGGQLFVGAEVERVLVTQQRAVGVRMTDGRELFADTVISDAGAPNTYTRLLDPQIAAQSPVLDALRAVEASSAHFSLYLGLDATDEALGLDGTNLWIYPEQDRERAFERFGRDPSAPFPVVYMSFPSAKDPDFQRRHPGHATVELVTFADYAWVERWGDTRWRRRPDEYEAFKRELSARLTEVAIAQRPSLAGHIVHSELSTPLTTQHFTAHPRGEIYGLAHTPARFRLALRAHTHVPGLYLTGQDLVSCGVAGALFGGAITASAVLGRRLVSSLAAQGARSALARVLSARG